LLKANPNAPLAVSLSLFTLLTEIAKPPAKLEILPLANRNGSAFLAIADI
jgi:hypothetical protein